MKLSADQLDCLKQISSGSPVTGAYCDEHVLNSLIDMGLIEQNKISLPIEMAGIRYYITQAGRKALSAHGK